MTKLYFHNALTSDTGTLPTTIQSGQGTPDLLSDAVNVNRSMDTTIGVSQASLSCVDTSSLTAGRAYFTRFLSSPLNMTTVSSDTWNYTFAAKETASDQFPCFGANFFVIVTLYVWRPSNGTRIGFVINGNSSANFSEPSATNQEQSLSGTFAGGSVGCQSGDILAFEVLLSCVNNNSTDTFYYDGTTETNNNRTVVSSQASHIESSTTTLTFLIPPPPLQNWAPFGTFVEH